MRCGKGRLGNQKGLKIKCVVIIATIFLLRIKFQYRLADVHIILYVRAKMVMFTKTSAMLGRKQHHRTHAWGIWAGQREENKNRHRAE